MARPDHKDFNGDDIAFWAAYRLWQSQQAYRALIRRRGVSQ